MTQDKFEEIANKCTVSEQQQDDVIVRLAKDGDKVYGVFCGEPFAREVVWSYCSNSYENYDPAWCEGLTPTLRVMFNFFVPSENKMRVVELSPKGFALVAEVHSKYGLDKWMFEIQRLGGVDDRNTFYNVSLDEAIGDTTQALIKEAQLHDLAEIAFRGK